MLPAGLSIPHVVRTGTLDAGLAGAPDLCRTSQLLLRSHVRARERRATQSGAGRFGGAGDLAAGAPEDGSSSHERSAAPSQAAILPRSGIGVLVHLQDLDQRRAG